MKIVTILTLICLILLSVGVYFHVEDLNKTPIWEVDEDIQIVAGIKAQDFKFNETATIVPTHPILGYFLFGLPTNINRAYFKEISDFPLDENKTIAEFWHENEEKFFNAILLMRIPLILSYLISLLFFYLICKLFYSPLSALFATMLLNFSIEWTIFSRVLYFEIPQLMFILISIFLLIKFNREKINYYFLGSLAFLALAIGTRLSSLYVLPAFIFFIFINNSFNLKERLKNIGATILISFMSLLAFFPLATNYIFSNKLLIRGSTEIYLGFSPILPIIAIFIKGWYSPIDPAYHIALILCIFLIPFFKKNIFTEKGFMALFFFSIIFVSFFVVSVHDSFGLISRYIVLATIPIYFYGGWAFETIINKWVK